jgi:hypothetical protein
LVVDEHHRDLEARKTAGAEQMVSDW